MIHSASSTRRFARYLERVLIVDANPASTRLMQELLKDLGAHRVLIESSTVRGLAVAKVEEPNLILCEYSGPTLDGIDFVRRLRRSDMACRQVPVIMVSAEATAASILGARDAGVHEFLRKPFTIKDLTRRVEAVTLKSRDWVEAVRYVGPDRRRFNSGDYKGARKRKSDSSAAAPSPSSRIEQALRILKSAIAETGDEKQVMRAILAQTAELTHAAVSTSDMTLITHATAVQRVAMKGSENGAMDLRAIAAACQPLWAYLPRDGKAA